jgi:hypothetical protein
MEFQDKAFIQSVVFQKVNKYSKSNVKKYINIYYKICKYPWPYQ